MLQKVLVILVGLVMSLIGAISPSGMFAANDALNAGLDVDPTRSMDATLATIRNADSAAFAKLSVLWVDVDGRRVTDDAWGTGEINEVKFKVGTKDVEGISLAVGDKLVPVHPTDVITVRLFRGDFSYRGMSSNAGTLQLQGTVKTALVNEGAPTGKLQTGGGLLGGAANDERSSIAYVVLSTGENVDTVAVQAGGARIQTEDTDSSLGNADVGNLLVQWVKVNGRAVREYTYGEGQVDLVEFEPASTASGDMLNYRGTPANIGAGEHIFVKDFVGEYLIYQVNGGLLRLRLDGYATAVTSGASGGGPTFADHGLPLPAFDVGPEVATTNDIIKFKDHSTDDGLVVFWKWSFGDGTSSVLQDPTHRYTKPGIYNVTLSVTDDDLHVTETTRPITIKNAQPVPDFDFQPKVVTTDLLVAFTDHSLDADGTVVNWTWSFGDGTTSFSRHPTHRFTKSGQATLSLIVTDDLGGRQTITRALTIRNTPPTAGFDVSPTSFRTLEPIRFVSTSTDKDGSIIDHAWDFGDGSKAHGAEVTHTFRHGGLHNVILKVTDNEGATDVAAVSVSPINRAPVPNFTYTPDFSPDLGNLTVIFESTTTDDDGCHYFRQETEREKQGYCILVNQWDFGDGSDTVILNAVRRFVTNTAAAQPDRTEITDDVGKDFGSVNTGEATVYTPPPKVSHRYRAPGYYNVTLQATDDLGDSSTVTRMIRVNNTAPKCEFVEQPGAPFYRDEVVQFTDVSIDPDSQAIRNRMWTISDGFTATNVSSFTHAFALLGNYSVKLHVEDGAGGICEITHVESVENRPPTAFIQASTTEPTVNQVVQLRGRAEDLDSNGPFTYNWTFPDGSWNTSQNTTIQFPQPLLYTVRLTVTDPDGGQSLPAAVDFNVDFALPEPDFTWNASTPIPHEPSEGDVVYFHDNSSTNNAYITGRQWTWGDATPSNTGNSSDPTHVFTSCGTPDPTEGFGFFVQLQVTDDQNQDIDTVPFARKHVKINCKPTAAFAVTTALPIGPSNTVNFTDASTDPEVADLNHHYVWGDGNVSDYVTSGNQPLNVSHTYEFPGNYNVVLTVTDIPHGASSTTQKTVDVSDRAPVARWKLDTPQPIAGGNTVFNGSASFDPDGDGTLKNWSWTFGDAQAAFGDQAAAEFTTHVYARSGLYHASLVVDDGVMTSNPNDPGAHRFVRVRANHDAPIDIYARFPNGTLADIGNPNVNIGLTLTGAQTEAKVMTKANATIGPLGATFTLGAGVWASGDIAIVTYFDARFMARPIAATVIMSDEHGLSESAEVNFNIPLKLKVTLDVLNDTVDHSPFPLVQGGTGPDDAPIYSDMKTAFHGQGRVAYEDGGLAPFAEFYVEMRYLPLALPGGRAALRDSAPISDNYLIGWCRADSGAANETGDFTWSVQLDTQCFLGHYCVQTLTGGCLTGNPYPFPPGHYQFRAKAWHGTATVTASATKSAYSDPTGILAPNWLP